MHHERCRRILQALAWILVALLPAGAWAQNATAGRAAFENYCIGCHGMPPAGGPERAGNNPSMIATAINGKVAAMGFLRGVVTSQEILDIAAWLGTLTAGPAGPIVPANDYSDLWFNEAEAGWGLNLIQHASHKMFGVMYTYDVTRKPMWLVIPDGTWTSPAIYTGTIYRVTGPPPTGTFNPALVSVRPVGTATINFSDRDHGTISYTMDGVAVSKSLARQPY